MSCLLSVYVGSAHKTRKLGEDAFLQLESAQKTIRAQHAIEARFDIFLENYITLESALANLLVAHTIRSALIFEPTDETHSVIARFLNNFLSSASGYKAEVVRYKLSQKPKAFRLLFEERKRQSSNYRIAEQLRNYDQHVSLLVHQWDLPSTWSDDRQVRRHGLGMSMSLSQFAMGVRGQSDVLADMEARKTKDGLVPLLPIVRKYVEELAELHHQVRQLLIHDFDEASSTIVGLKNMATEMGAKEDGIIRAVSHAGEWGSEKILYVHDAMMISVRAFRKRNRTPLPNFGLIEFFL